MLCRLEAPHGVCHKLYSVSKAPACNAALAHEHTLLSVAQLAGQPATRPLEALQWPTRMLEALSVSRRLLAGTGVWAEKQLPHPALCQGCKIWDLC